MNREELLDEIQRLACSCDVMRGYACPIHAPINKLRKLLSPARGDGVRFNVRQTETESGCDIWVVEFGDLLINGYPSKRRANDVAKALNDKLASAIAATPTPPSAEGEYGVGDCTCRIDGGEFVEVIEDAKCPVHGAAPVSTERMVDGARLLEVIRSYHKGRCYCCGWPTADKKEDGCVPGDCSYRPSEQHPTYARWHERMIWLHKALSPQPQEDSNAK